MEAVLREMENILQSPAVAFETVSRPVEETSTRPMEVVIEPAPVPKTLTPDPAPEIYEYNFNVGTSATQNSQALTEKTWKYVLYGLGALGLIIVGIFLIKKLA